jgi:hypothetical protein
MVSCITYYVLRIVRLFLLALLVTLLASCLPVTASTPTPPEPTITPQPTSTPTATVIWFPPGDKHPFDACHLTHARDRASSSRRCDL